MTSGALGLLLKAANHSTAPLKQDQYRGLGNRNDTAGHATPQLSSDYEGSNKALPYLVHGWDRIKNVHSYSFLSLSTHKNDKCYPTMTKLLLTTPQPPYLAKL